MAIECKFCSRPISWARDEKKEKWVGIEVWSVNGDEEDFEGSFFLEHWHVPHRCREYKKPTPQTSGSHASVLFVVENAPHEVIQAAYRALAKKYHPDLGGNTEQMQKINNAYEQLMKGHK